MSNRTGVTLGTVRTDTYGVTITSDTGADIVCDLEDEIVDKAIMYYHRRAHYNKLTDELSLVFWIAPNEEGDEGDFHAYTSGVKAKDRLARVDVTVFRMTQRM